MSKRRTLSLAVLGTVTFLVLMVASAPATIIIRFLPDGSLAGVRGSLWDGSASAVTVNGVNVGGLRWSVSPTTLLAGSPMVTFELSGQDLAVTGVARHSLWSGRSGVTDLQGDLALALISRVSGIERAVDSNISFEGVGARFNAGVPVQAIGTIHLRAVTVIHPQRRRLGDYALRISAADGWLQGDVISSDGPLEVTGSSRFIADGRWQLDLRLRTSTGDPDLESVLDIIGEPDAEGYRSLFLVGSLDR